MKPREGSAARRCTPAAALTDRTALQRRFHEQARIRHPKEPCRIHVHL
jgi:hypothetical protein